MGGAVRAATYAPVIGLKCHASTATDPAAATAIDLRAVPLEAQVAQER